MKKFKRAFLIIGLFIFFCNCKAKHYTEAQKERIRITDSIARAEKQSLQQDFQEDMQMRENYEN